MNINELMKNSLAKKSVVEQIVDSITDVIISGDLAPGDKLPTENELCDTFQVGRNSVREAIKILEAYGVVEIRRAEGTFISKKYNYKMLYPVIYGIILQKDAQDQVVSLRKVMDIGVLRVAINIIQEKDIDLLKKTEEEMRLQFDNPSPNSELIYKLDTKFHSIITDILDNQILDSIGYYVDQITRKSRILTITKIIEEKQTEKFLDLHKAIIEILANKETEKIDKIVNEHYQFWNNK
ncbi:MAG TPA: GntR family transcriptional regulator [Candidatus Dorea intestinavium]|nr:GntR family transcriptional regulator [Candidatus Dorea intestinavium]